MVVVVADIEPSTDEGADHRSRPHPALKPGLLRPRLDDSAEVSELDVAQSWCRAGECQDSWQTTL